MTDMTLAGPGPVRFGATEAMEPRQGEPPPLDSGLACLVMMARLHGVAADADQLAHEFGGASAHTGLQIQDILLAAKKLALQAKRVKVDLARLDKTPLPAIAMGRDEQGHAEFFILARVEADKALIQSPKAGRPEAISIADLKARWPGGELILFTSRASLAGEMARFDFTWFIPAVVKYRKLLLEVLAVSFVLQLFALITPLFFQVVMDKVLVHRGYTTLDVIAIAKGRTVIIVAHRLSAVRDANRIVVMERGQIVETGPHAQLLQIPDGAYAALHRLQQG